MLLTLEMVLLFKYAAQYREAIRYGGQIWVWIHPAPNPDLQNMITQFFKCRDKCEVLGSWKLYNAKYYYNFNKKIFPKQT